MQTYVENRDGSASSSQLDQVRQEIASYFNDDAFTIANVALSEPLSIVTGPHGNGKSQILLPRVGEMLTNSGVDTVYLPCEQLFRCGESPAQLIDRRPATSMGVLILDEAGWVYDRNDKDRHQAALQSAYEKGWHVVAVIAHGTHQIKARNDEVEKWADASGTQNPTVTHLAPFRLTRELAQEYLLASRQAHHDNPLSPEIMDFILDHAPHNLRLLDRFSQKTPRSLEETIHEMKRQLSFLIGVLLPEEHTAIYNLDVAA